MCHVVGRRAVSGSKRLKRAIGYSGKQGTHRARRVAHKAIEQDVSKWIGWVASTQGQSELSVSQQSYAIGKAYKSSMERNN